MISTGLESIFVDLIRFISIPVPNKGLDNPPLSPTRPQTFLDFWTNPLRQTF